MVQYAARNLVKDRGDVLHVLYVALEQEHCEKPQRQVRSCSVLILGQLTHKLLVKMESYENGLQDQELFSWQYGALLRGMPHRLHIIQVVQNVRPGDKASAAAYIARAICVKAEQLRSSGVSSPHIKLAAMADKGVATSVSLKGLNQQPCCSHCGGGEAAGVANQNHAQDCNCRLSAQA